MAAGPGSAVAAAARWLVLVALAVAGGGGAAAAGEAALWAAVRDGEAFAMIRHALAPGFGDPPHFTLGDCATQRNLSDQGRAQAQAIGARFRDHGIAEARVYTSEWCRCRETADLLGLGPPTALPALNSFFSRPERRAAQTAALASWLADRRDEDRPLVLVTHQVNIGALTAVGTGSGEIVVARREADGRITVLGTL
ncbi:MAG: histidine phosphatase family protein [Rhodospirillales bacterium]